MTYVISVSCKYNLIIAQLPRLKLVRNNDHKPFTNCRDTQEILPDVGDQILRIFCAYNTNTSLFESPSPAPKYSVFEEHFLN